MIFASFFDGFPVVERARAQYIICRYVGFPVLSNIPYWASCAHPARPELHVYTVDPENVVGDRPRDYATRPNGSMGRNTTVIIRNHRSGKRVAAYLISHASSLQ